MKTVILVAPLLLLAGCGTTSKRIVSLPPLPDHAPVQVFWTKPNIKYRKICEIEAFANNSLGTYNDKEDFEDLLKKEARKCGADGVIFSSIFGFERGNLTAYGTGIKITSHSAGLSDENTIKAFSLAIQSHDLPKVRELLARVPKRQSDRAPTDDELINVGLYIATLDGMNCDSKIVSLLENEYEGRFPGFRAVNFAATGRYDSDTPLCNDVIARSLPEMKDKSSAIIEVNNHYVGLLKDSFDNQLNNKAAKYEKLLRVASKMIADSCRRSATDPTCAMKGAYLDFARKTRGARSSAVKKNANEILRNLQR